MSDQKMVCSICGKPDRPECTQRNWPRCRNLSEERARELLSLKTGIPVSVINAQLQGGRTS